MHLNVGGVEVSAGKFLRSDILNTTDQGINVRNNAGLTIGVDGNFQVTTSSTAAKLYNSSAGSSVDLQVNRNGIPTTVLRVLDNKVGINIAAPDEALDVDGNIGLTGALKISSTAETTNLSTGSIVTTGGAAITKNLLYWRLSKYYWNYYIINCKNLKQMIHMIWVRQQHVGKQFMLNQFKQMKLLVQLTVTLQVMQTLQLT